MSYGVKSYGDDGYLNLHSDYSSLVYIGEASVNVNPLRAVYTGEGAETISNTRLRTHYDMGYIVQFRIQGAYSHIVPFYLPYYTGQEIAIIDMYDGGTYWDINVLFSGFSNQAPAIHVFAPLTEIPNPTQSDYGLTVYDANGDIVFTDRYRPLRVDDVVTVTHPGNIKAGSRGSCGNDAGCDINYTPDQSSTATGSVDNTSTKMYHVVTSAYGGLAYQNSGTYSQSCGFLNLGKRKYAWGYQSWTSFRGTMSHPHNTANHIASYAGDFCGKIHQLKSGSCGFSGFLGALIGLVGIVLAPLTFGASLTLTAGVAITAAIVGFAVGEALSPSTPALRAYEQDDTFDTANTQNLIMTDASYYGIETGSSDGGSDLTYLFNDEARQSLTPFEEGDGEYFWNVNEYGDTGELQFGEYMVWGVWDGVQPFVNYGYTDPTFTALNTADVGPNDTSVTATDGYTYYRGEYRSSFTTNVFFLLTEDHYEIARE